MNNTDTEPSEGENVALFRAKFTIFLVLQMPAIAFSLLIFIFFIKHRAVASASQNHGLVILFVLNFIQLIFDMPLNIDYYRIGRVNPAVPSYCIWWTYFEYIITAVSEYLLAVIAVQRHIFIFHQHVLRIRWKAYLFHTVPLVLSVLYPAMFYTFAILVYPCDNTQWDYRARVCGFANCYMVYDKFLGSFDLLFNNSLPVVIDVLANVGLILRVIAQKRRARQAVGWRQQRRMVIQLFGLSTIYIIAWIPFLLVELIITLGGPPIFYQLQMNYFSDLLYLVYFLLPWVYLGFFPELLKWFRKLSHWQKSSNAIGTTQNHTILNAKQPKNIVGTTQAPSVEPNI